MSDLLKEAIADAKAVRETALQNAKMALQEAFTPQLKNMLSAKLREDEFEDEEENDEAMHDAMHEPEEAMHEPEEAMHEPEEAMHEPEEAMHDDMDEFGHDDEPEMEKEGVIEINGVKYAPVVAEDEMYEGSRPGEQPQPEVNEDLELESIIKELESDLNEEDDAYDQAAPPENDGLAEQDDAYTKKVEGTKDSNHVKGVNETNEYEITEELFKEEDEDEDKMDETINFNGKTYKMVQEAEHEEDEDDTVDEQSTSSGIGKGTGVKYATSGDGEDPGKGKLYKENQEYKQAVKFLKDKLHEVNILNAKLLFTNKLFKEFALNNNQKIKVVENFDRAHTTREIKLVYSTLCESFNGNKSGIRKKSINEVASAKIGSTKPSRKIITESDAIAERFMKLANIKK